MKNNKINIELLIFLRVYMMQHYANQDLSTLMVTIPVSLSYEQYILSFGLQILYHLQSQFTTTIFEDYAILKDPTINYKQRFAVVFRISQKQILENQINLYKQALNIVALMQQGKTLREAYLTDFDNLKDQHKLVHERHKIKCYLLQLKQSLDLRML